MVRLLVATAFLNEVVPLLQDRRNLAATDLMARRVYEPKVVAFDLPLVDNTVQHVGAKLDLPCVIPCAPIQIIFRFPITDSALDLWVPIGDHIRNRVCNRVSPWTL